jgi:lipopolysaccharide export system permease protein
VTLTLLDRLLLTEVGSSFGFGLGLFTVLLVMNHLFYLARLVIGQGMAVHTAALLMLYKVPYFVAFSAPMGVLLASVLGVGRLNDHHEIAALRVCGVSLYRIALPLVLGGAVAAVAILAFSEGVVSPSDDRYRALLADVVARGSDVRPVENVFFQAPTPTGNALYSARRYDPRTRTLADVTVVYVARGQPLEVIEAEEAVYQGGVRWTFRRGRVYMFSGGHVVTTTFQSLSVVVPRSPHDLTLAPRQPSEMSIRELLGRIAALRREGGDVRPFVGELHARLATAASSVVFTLVALPVSLRPHRSGPSMGLGLSILVLLGYYLVAIPAQLASDGRLLSPVLAAWLPDLVVGAAGLVLLVRAAR